MKTITKLVVTYEDGSTEDFVGPGQVHVTATYKEVETGVGKQTIKEPVRFVTAEVNLSGPQQP